MNHDCNDYTIIEFHGVCSLHTTLRQSTMEANLVVLDETKQHGYDHFPLGIKLLPHVRLLPAVPNHKHLLHDGLQGGNGCRD